MRILTKNVVHARQAERHQSRDDPRAEVGEDVRVGPMQFQLNHAIGVVTEFIRLLFCVAFIHRQRHIRQYNRLSPVYGVKCQQQLLLLFTRVCRDVV